MRQFQDNKNRKWNLEVTGWSLKRVRDMCGIELVELVGKNLTGKLARDPILLCNILYALVKPQCDEAKVTDESFGEALFGDAIEYATEALILAIIDFFPSSRQALLTATLAKGKEINAKLMEAALQRVEDADVQKLVQEFEKELTPSNGSAGNSEGSSESIPDRSP